jgi:trans-aconitate methyltransferase
MRLENAITLIKNSAISSTHPQQWTDFGCGSGLFTHALATLLQKHSVIHAIDKNIRSFEGFAVEGIAVQKKQLDFVTADIDLKDLDGILMANSLHYVKNKLSFINKLSTTIKPTGSILIVEYDTDKSNPWVPYPVSFTALQQLFNDHGFRQIIKLNEQPSVFGRANIYSALIKQ